MGFLQQYVVRGSSLGQFQGASGSPEAKDMALGAGAKFYSYR